MTRQYNEDGSYNIVYETWSDERLDFYITECGKWYNGEISENKLYRTLSFTYFEGMTPIETSDSETGQDASTYVNYPVEYYGVSGGTFCTDVIKLTNVSTAEEVVEGIYQYKGFKYPQDAISWDWVRTLLYLKIHTEGDNVYIYMVP